ncbi:MAG: thioredoxin domain-containing protein, partial [Dehalococcoidia bacterium]|nr:thioredoxin domain-containing protein [Dehalococcoidia bacterium]
MANKKKREPRIRESQPQSRTQPRQQSKSHPPQRGRQRASRAQRGPSRTTLVAGVGAAAVVVALVIILVSLMGRATGTPATTGESATKGNPDAKVTVVEYSDFQCPFCAQFALQTFPSVDQTYIQTGKVKWTFHNMARIGDESKQAAQAAECAGDQGKFWPYHDKLYVN